ncbi:fibulin-1-like [Stylophora pistillata]|uniref:fibulin-1-like n=1 Tax=Stylophora pistillata TaxID=50429 RepID=UPI000C045194|nr:fibulin-1-like [Stylophora pistillata]
MKMAGLGLSFIFLLFLFGGWFYTLTVANHDSCRRLKFLQQRDGYALLGHVFKNISLPVGMHLYSHCRNWCTMEDRCKSINMGPSGEKDKVLCQLSDSDHLQHLNDLKSMAGFMYRGTENKCCFNVCYNNATCLVGFTNKGYKCLCPPGYTGEHCEKDVDECTTNTPDCDVNAECSNTEGSFNCSCKVGFNGDGKKCTDVDECTTDAHNCDTNAECNNTEGSFNCTCKAGFDGDGKKCTAINLQDPITRYLTKFKCSHKSIIVLSRCKLALVFFIWGR